MQDYKVHPKLDAVIASYIAPDVGEGLLYVRAQIEKIIVEKLRCRLIGDKPIHVYRDIEDPAVHLFRYTYIDRGDVCVGEYIIDTKWWEARTLPQGDKQ